MGGMCKGNYVNTIITAKSADSDAIDNDDKVPRLSVCNSLNNPFLAAKVNPRPLRLFSILPLVDEHRKGMALRLE
jgi:hypothetical protein